MADYIYNRKGKTTGLSSLKTMTKTFKDILIDHANDDFWLVLKYPSKDCLTNSAYTISKQDKIMLASKLIRPLRYSNDVDSTAHSEIRIYQASWEQMDNVAYRVWVGFDIISGNDIIELENGQLSIDVLRDEIQRLFIDAETTEFGAIGSDMTRGSIRDFNDEFQGYTFLLVGITR